MSENPFPSGVDFSIVFSVSLCLCGKNTTAEWLVN